MAEEAPPRSPPDAERLRRLLGGEALSDLRRRLRERYARGRSAQRITLSALAAHERRALEGLLGRAPSAATSMRLDFEEIDAALSRAGLAPDLRAALEILDGPILDRAAARAAAEATWAAVVATAKEPRLAALLREPAELGMLKRAAAGDPQQAEALIVNAERVMAQLPAQGLSLAQLAAESVGDAHALDAGSELASLVLRAAAPIAESGTNDGDMAKTSSPRARDRWARLGVAVNELAAPVLILNLDAMDDTPGGRLASAARVAGEPLHLSLRCLLCAPPRWRVAGRDVFVCENPAVVTAAADRLGTRCAPLVCSDGMPAAAQRVLLDQLLDAGARLRYHGDFDWPGLAIGNFLRRRFAAEPWRFAADDYRPVAGRPLGSRVVEASWDTQLASRMRVIGLAQDEESMIEVLLGDLASGCRQERDTSEHE
jgi:uncharacterized protein (TIGR02679 family)